MSRYIPLGLIALSIGLAAIGGYLAFAPPPPRSSLELTDPVHDLGSMQPGKHEFTFHVVNRGNADGAIIGFYPACGDNCCYGTDQWGRFNVAPGETIPYTCNVTLLAPGPFEVSMNLFLDDNGLRTLPVLVKGICIAPGSKADVTSKP